MGRGWTRDILPVRKDLVPSYLSAHDEELMRPWYDDFAERYGLLLGPAARRATQAARNLAVLSGTGGEPAARG
jgi:hypothetical protein